jgi:nicotinamide-nucleotide amidase
MLWVEDLAVSLLLFYCAPNLAKKSRSGKAKFPTLGFNFETMKVHLINIGDELLIGQVVNTNSAWMAQQLNLYGARVTWNAIIGDDVADIHRALADSLVHADAVLITGGLGPTKDDLTAKALADFLGVEMVFHEPTCERISRMMEKWGRQMTEAHKGQCFMPANALILHNKMGTAPGMWFDYEGKVIVCMPGVPFEMQYLMENEVIPRLRERFPGLPIAHRTILTVGEGESIIAERLADFEESLPPHIKLAYLPAIGQVRLRLTGTGENEAELNAQLDAKAAELSDLLSELVFGQGNDQLEAAVGRMLLERGLWLGTAESCTGGYLAHLITSIPGASGYFKGSIIAYANEIKMERLGVRADTLQQYGAVSQETVIEMVHGAVSALGVDVAVAISGIAGPTGGTDEKPVGTVWIAVGNAGRITAKRFVIGRDRLKTIQAASVQALNMLRQWLIEESQGIIFV